MTALFFGMHGPARAAATVDLDTARVNATADLALGTVDATAIPADFLSDAAHPLSVDDVASAGYAAQFRPVPHLDNVPYVSGWLRFSLRAGTAPSGWLLIAPATFSEADLYTSEDGAHYTLTRFGMLVPFKARTFKAVDYPALPVSRQLANGRPVYLHFTRHWGPVAVFAANRETAIVTEGDYSRHDFTWIGLYLAIAISNFLLFGYLRDRTFLAYACAMCVIMLWLLASAGHAWAILWPWASLPFWQVTGLALGFWWLAMAVFARSFLDLAQRAPRLDKLVIATSAFAFLYTAIFEGFQAWTYPEWMWDYGDLLAASFMFCTLLLCGAVLLRRGMTTARFYVVGLAGYLVGTICSFARSIPSVEAFFGVLPWPLTDPGQLGVAWEALFLTFAIADRVRAAKAEAFDALEAREHALQQLAEGQKHTLARLSSQNLSMERFVPRAFLQHLGKDSVEDLQLGDHTLAEMTLLFSDIRSFTSIAESMTAQDTFEFINSYLAHAGPIVREHNGFIDKYIGDAIMALFPESANHALDAAIRLQSEVVRYNQSRARAGDHAIAIGVGLHRGVLALGTIGESKRIETTVIADAVNMASRMEGLTKLFGAGIIITETVVANLEEPERYRLRCLGHVQVKGTSRGLEVFEAYDADAAELILSKFHSREPFADAVAAFTAGHFDRARAIFTSISEATPGDRPAAHFAQRCRELMAMELIDTWDGTERLEAK